MSSVGRQSGQHGQATKTKTTKLSIDVKSAEEQEQQLLEIPEYRFSRRLMIFMRKLSRCPLVDRSLDELRAARKPNRKLKLAAAEDRNYHEKAIRNGLLSDVIFVCYLFSSIHVDLVLYHQYKLNWNSVRHDYLTFRRYLGTSDQHCFHKCSHRPVPDGLLRRLSETIQEENRILDLLGQPLQDLSYFGAGIYCVQFLSNFVAYVLPQINFNYFKPYDSYILRILVDYKRELKLCRLLVREQVNEFLISHQNSTKTITIWHASSELHDRHKQEEAIDSVRDIWERDRFIEHELFAMEARDELLPPNRRVEWIRSWLTYHLAITSLGLLGGLAGSNLLISLASLLPFLKLHDSDKVWLDYYWNDWIIIVESSLIMSVLCVSVILFGVTLTFGSLDQLWLAKDIRSEYECVLLKSQSYSGLASSSSPLTLSLGEQATAEQPLDDEAERNKLNCNLLALLIKFRIFVRQLASERKSSGFNVFTVTFGFLLLPVVSRLHAPYFEPSLMGIKIFLSISSVLVLVPMTVSLLPPCEMFSQCVLLHRAQVKLLAHLVEVEQLRPNFYNGHLVSRLRRETSSSARLKDDFAISFAGFHFTYSSVIRFYFWFGALILTALFRPGAVVTADGKLALPTMDTSNAAVGVVRSKAQRRNFPVTVDSILDDPFGILSW